ncbi:MAG TPA: hypothetical protein VH681_04660, partial [Nitrospiraceae bacterium]
WLVMAGRGYFGRTCGWPVVRASLVAALVPASLLGLMLSIITHERLTSLAFGIGILVVPSVGIVLGMRTLPDGTRVAARFLEGAQTMMETILGRHHECGGCSEEHPRHEDHA